MYIMQMLGILGFVFFAAMFMMCFFKERLKNPLINPLYIGACAVFFFCWNYAAYERGWLEDGFMTLENISPYICTIILLTPFMGKRVKDFANCSIAFLAFGMFLAMFISPAFDFLFNYNLNAKFMHISEATCHLVMALYGFYLILSGKVKLTLKNYAKSMVFIYLSIGFGVFLNWCFHLGNFGMNMYGDYSIYFLNIFGSFEITFIAYLLGVLGTLTLGFLVGIFLNWFSKTKETEKIIIEDHTTEPDAVEIDTTEI